MAITLGNDGTYDTITSNTNGSTGTNGTIKLKTSELWIEHDEALISFDEGEIMITSNDSHGNFQIKAGVNNDNVVVSDSSYTGSPQAIVQMNTDTSNSSGNGDINIGTGAWVANGGSAAFNDGVQMSFVYNSSDKGIFVGDPQYSDYPSATRSANNQIANRYRPYGDYTVKAWATYEQLGTHSFYDDIGFSSISDQGTGYSRLTFSNTMPNQDYAVTMMENVAGDGGHGGGADNANGNRPGNTSWVQIDNRTSPTNANYDKRWAAIQVFGKGTGN
jgi:hypothetical protein